MAKKKKTYAEIADKITKEIGKHEKALKSSDRFAKATAERTLPKLKAKLDKLFNAQERSKVAKVNKYAEKMGLGGYNPKMQFGGPVEPMFLDPNTGKPLDPDTLRYVLAEEQGFNPEQIDQLMQRYADQTGIDITKPSFQTAADRYAAQTTGEDLVYNQAQSQYRPNQPPIESGLKQAFEMSGQGSDFGMYEVPYQGATQDNIYPSDETKTTNIPTTDTGNTQGSPLTGRDILYGAAVGAPTAYNIIQGLRKPQELSPEDYYNPYESKALGLLEGRKYNIDPQLQANRRGFNAMERLVGSAAGGSGASYLANIGAAQQRKQQSDAQAYSTKQNIENQYKGQLANAYSQFGQQRAATDLQIQDINDRNRARRNAYLAQGLTGVSQLAQQGRYMRNLSDADKIRARTLQYMYPDFQYGMEKGYKPTGEITYEG